MKDKKKKKDKVKKTEEEVTKVEEIAEKVTEETVETEAIEEVKESDSKEEVIEIAEEFKDIVDEKEEEEYEFYRPTISSSTYGETVNNLVKEVQLFHEEGEIEPQKKSKLILIIGIVAFILAIMLIAFLLLGKDKPENKKKTINTEETTYNYEYKEFEDRIEFYDGEEVIDTYTCMSETCSIYSSGRYSYFSTKPTVIALSDDDSVFLYNYIEKKTISSFYSKLQNLIKEDRTVAFIAYDADNLVGIIDINGNVIVPLNYDEIGYSMGGGDVSDYSYETNLITVMQDGLWGLISLSDGKIILDLKYEDIYYNGFNAVVIKEDGLWYLLGLDGKKILADGYDIIIPTKSYIFVSSENSFNILNYKGNNIISKDIPTYIRAFRERSVTITPTFKIDIDGTIINIHIMKDEKNYVEYKFNTVNGELTEVIK
jgi:hypothetical protein